MTVIDWLLDADPSIRWQVMRDLTHEPADVIAAERARVATEGWGARLLALQAPDGLWGGRPGRTTGRTRSTCSSSCGGWGSIPRASRPGGRSASSARTSLGATRVRDALGRQPVLRRRGRAVHQRQRRRDRLVLRGGHDAARRPAPGRAAPGRRLELRGRERRDGVVVRDDDQRPRGPARARARDRRLGRGRGGPPPRRGVPAGAPPVPPQVDRRGDRSAVAPVLLPALAPLRHPSRSGVPARGGRRTRPTCRRGDRGRGGHRDPDGRWPLQSASPGQAHFEMEAGEGKPSRWNTLRAMRVLSWFAPVW